MLIAIHIAFLFTASVAPDHGCKVESGYHLEQPYEVFDQSNEGWRQLADNKCYVQAASIIERYIEERSSEMRAAGKLRTLYWHAGQMRAVVGDYSTAIGHFENAYPRDGAPVEMHLKADAVLAFLRKDRNRLEQIYQELIALPEPAYFTDAVNEIRERDPEARLPEWPLGLRSLKEFIKCFEEPYVVAYLSDQCDS